MKAPALKRCSGFTLIELIIVILILGILATLANQNIRPLVQSLRLRTATDMVKNRIMTARTRAIANPYVHCGVYFSISSTPQSYLIFFDNSSSGDNYMYNSGSDKSYLSSEQLPKGITFERSLTNQFTNDAIVFRGDGSAKYGGQIVLKDQFGKSRTIDVLPSTGRIKVIR